MTRKVLVLHEGSSYDLSETPAASEHHLQEVMKANPKLLPVDDLGITGPLLVVGREARVSAGSIDLVGVVPSGDLVLVEFKTGPQNPDFRHALAQLIDYGSSLWGMTVDELGALVERYLQGPFCPASYSACESLEDLVKQAWSSDDFSWEEFVDRLGTVLVNGDFHFVVAAQKITPQITRSVEYLNTTVRVGRYHLVQMIQLDGHGMTAYAAESKSSTLGGHGTTAVAGVSEESFLAAIEDVVYREALSDVFDNCRALGLTLAWGARGTSIRLATPDRSEPISVAWVFPGVPSWSGLTHVTLGYDASSAKNTPSVDRALAAYVEQVAQISGATEVKSKGLKAYTWNPTEVKAVKSQIVEAIAALVVAASGEESEEPKAASSP